MKLFVWNDSDTLCDHKHGMVIALGNDLHEALLAISAIDSQAVRNITAEKPTQIVDLKAVHDPLPSAWVCWGGG